MTLPRVIFAGTVLLGACLAGAAGQSTSCDPSCVTDCTPGDKVPNPRNCAQYYECLEDCLPSDIVFDCSEGNLFDTTTAECQPESDSVTCGYCQPPCSYSCDGDAELAAVRGDCSSALLCSFSPPLTASCSDEPDFYFNGTSCQADASQCCDPCEVFCEAPFTEIADPTSCTSFYYCSRVGYPLPGDKHECPDGEYFIDGHCGGDPADCDVFCGDEVTTTPPSTTTTVPAGRAGRPVPSA